jgi:hypothetical protein
MQLVDERSECTDQEQWQLEAGPFDHARSCLVLPVSTTRFTI